ncbi:MAG: nicotinate-nucleotide--dimethylbenzimidazole phosphoribosyltransferase [Lachnospiraceae bacterium]|nr:nicotinate-nucleotide--dimethylbenzimidazole phosphoribosyltransferase [Lachnospiraceae bacterium]
MTEEELKQLLNRIPQADGAAVREACKRQAMLAKPPGSLGSLEEIAVRLAGITGSVCSRIGHPHIMVFAADHGVTEEGVSSAPQSVTLQQCLNMGRHKTGMSALAGYFHDEVTVVDVGIAADGPWPGIVDRKIRKGSRNLYREPALTREEVLAAIEAGIETTQACIQAGADAVGVGEMGIGNTTPSSAVLAALLSETAEAVTGCGGGLTADAFSKKRKVIAEALERHQPDRNDVVDVLSKVGGPELAAMTGAYLACALHRVPAVVDGFISIVTALCAVRLCPQVRDVLFLSHVSEERGYLLAQKELGLAACLQLHMRLGEGSGCPLMFRVLEAACAVMCDMATFDEGSINDDYLKPIREEGLF